MAISLDEREENANFAPENVTYYAKSERLQRRIHASRPR